ncbi:hypothetical protein BH11ARM2_BH11ARM2_12180 [soil metagenome]
MALAAAASGQVRSADVIYTYRDGIAARGLRVGDELFLPLDALSKLGWSLSLRGGDAQIDAEGSRTTVGVRSVGGRDCIPLRRTLEKLGAVSMWESGDDMLDVLAPLTKIVARDGTVQVEGPLQFLPSVSTLISPSRVVFDFKGAVLSPDVAQDVDGSAKISQYKPDTVRLVVETPVLPRLDPSRPNGTRTFQFDIPRKPSEAVRPITPRTSDPAPAPQRGSTTLTQLDLSLDLQGPNSTLLNLALPPGLTGDPQINRTAPDVVEIFLPGVTGSLPDDARPNTDAISNVAARTDATGTTLTLYLSGPMGAEVSVNGSVISIQLLRPSLGGGLAGKVIVVDPGHGGHDSGAKGGDAREKELTLAIGKLLADELSAQGATVILTRKTDVFIPLDARANMANRSQADLFISVHINSTGGSPSQTGSITFFHNQIPQCKLLADCIQREVARVNQLPNLGTWSDTRIYRSGFAVLRQTKMPGVLLELGFINHPRDRARMLTADFQQKIARAVVKGVRVYLGDAETN